MPHCHRMQLYERLLEVPWPPATFFQMPVWVGSHCLLLQSLAMPHNPSPLCSLLPFFPAMCQLCFTYKLSLTCRISFPPLSLADLKSVNTTLSAHLRAENARSYPSSPRKTSPLPFAPQRAANTSRCHSSSPWGLGSRDALCTLICFRNRFILHLCVVPGLVPHENTHSQMKLFPF